MKPRTPVKRASAKWLAKNPDLARAGKTVRSSPVQRSPQKTRKAIRAVVAWEMCGRCHTLRMSAADPCWSEGHLLGARGTCGQCGKSRCLLTCEVAAFRKPPSVATKPKAKPKAINAARKKKNFDRSYGEKRAWIVEQDCAVCGYHAPSEPAHTKGDGGAGRKSSAKYLVPLCPPHFVVVNIHNHREDYWDEGCHAESHGGVKTFEAYRGVSLVALAAEYHERWLSSVAKEGA